MRGSAAFALVAAIAAYFVAPDSTPIDRALPFVVVLLAVCCFTTEAQRTQSLLCALCVSVALLPP
ncbi:MAG TPA: hypothetical protein VEK56_15440, partial [Vicinamibacterales bacterium]|nr:hypothetical protein [Vicinamibacterales bacterium]